MPTPDQLCHLCATHTESDESALTDRLCIRATVQLLLHRRHVRAERINLLDHPSGCGASTASARHPPGQPAARAARRWQSIARQPRKARQTACERTSYHLPAKKLLPTLPIAAIATPMHQQPHQQKARTEQKAKEETPRTLKSMDLGHLASHRDAC